MLISLSFVSDSYSYNYTAVPYQVNPYPTGRGPQTGCECEW